MSVTRATKRCTKTLQTVLKTSDINLSHHQLFMSIRQIFDHIFVLENKVSKWQNFRKFGSLRKFKNRFGVKNVQKLKEMQTVAVDFFSDKDHLITFHTIYISWESSNCFFTYQQLNRKLLMKIRNFLYFKGVRSNAFFSQNEEISLFKIAIWRLT